MQGILTILEAEVEESRWDELQQIYTNETANIPEDIRQTFLVQSKSQPRNWQIITHWRSQADLDTMRATVDVPVAVRIFQTVGATPQLNIWNIAVQQAGR